MWVHIHTVDEMEEFYKAALPRMREAAKECGYALGLHGSMRRDLDLIAAPWVSLHSTKDALAKAIHYAACGITQEKYDWTCDPPKPCGRLTTVFPIVWCEWHDMISAGHVDLSVMPDLDIEKL